MVVEKLLTPEELREALNIPNLSWVYYHTRQKGEFEIPQVRVGRYVRFRLSEVIAWLEARQRRERK